MIRLAFQVEILQNGLRKKIERERQNGEEAIKFQEGDYQPEIKVSELCEETACLYKSPADWIKIRGSFLLFLGSWLLTMISTLSIGLLVENALLSVTVMSAVTLICFGISVKFFKWE